MLEILALDVSMSEILEPNVVIRMHCSEASQGSIIPVAHGPIFAYYEVLLIAFMSSYNKSNILACAVCSRLLNGKNKASTKDICVWSCILALCKNATALRCKRLFYFFFYGIQT